MNNKLLHAIFIFCIFFFFPLHGQLDPAFMATLSADQRKQLLRQYGGKDQAIPMQTPTANLPTRDVEVEKPDQDSFEDRSDFLEELTTMERMISADVSRLQNQINTDNSVQDNELLEALTESQSLLRKIKALQRREIEKRAEEFGKSERDAIKPFGYDLFASDPSTFAPGNEVPIPSDYRIGPGDFIEIQLFGQRNESFSLGISREGMIRFPGIGPINAFEKGTNFIALKNHLREKIREQLGEGVQSSITLGAFRSIRIFLLGEVRKQGAYTVSALSTTINALLSCGGIKETGSLRTIQLKRAGKIISTLDLYDLLLRGDTSLDQALQPGDVIFIPVVEKQISISGAVRRPAKYEIKGDETLEDAVRLAGGSSDLSVLDLIRLERLDPNYHPIVRNLNYTIDKNMIIQSGDQISIGFAGTNIQNVVSLVGAVEKAGDFEWKENLLLSDLVNTPEDMSPNIDLDYGLIRRKSEDGKINCTSFIPRDLLKNSRQSIQIPLYAKDTVFFFLRESRQEVIRNLLAELRNQNQSGQFTKIVRISGAVHFPGEYPYTDSMVLPELIRAAGGTKDSAYLMDAEVTRIMLDKDQKAYIEHLKIDQNKFLDKNRSANFHLKPYDSLSIKPIPLWREGESVEINGEVNFPGIYSIKLGETLFDVIQRAGGLTDTAFAGGAFFTRESLRIKEDEQIERLIKQLESDLATATLSASDTEEAAKAQSAARAMLSRLKSSESQGRLVIDLNEVLKAGEDSDLLVTDKDSLLIPSIPYAVSVSGEVQFPTSHLHDEKLDLDDYLNRSGGYTQNADKDRTFVVKANGSVLTKGGNAWFGKGLVGNRISPGDVIVVPIDIRQTRFLENLTYSTQIIYQLAVAAAAVNSF